MSPDNVENTRHIVDVDKEELADEDIDLEGEGEEILYGEVEIIVVLMATAHIQIMCLKFWT